MKKNIVLGLLAFTLITSCNKDKEILSSIQTYNTQMLEKGYHFGDKINLPTSVTDNAKEVEISFGYTQTNNLNIDPKHYTLGNNAVTFNITKSNGDILRQEATIKVLSNTPEVDYDFEIVAHYPHDPANFVQGFQLVGNTIYESDGQRGKSRLIQYTLGETQPSKVAKQPNDVFSEGSTVVNDKVFQLTWQKRIGFIYDKESFKEVGRFQYPSEMKEGWGLTYDGTFLIASDGTSNLYFLNLEDPSKLDHKIGVAGNTMVYDRLNELEYHNGFIYANVWQSPIILKINPKTGAVVGRYNFSKLLQENTNNADDVLNGIAFKGDHMLVTGKNWNKIYEVKTN